MAGKGSSFERDVSKYLSAWLTGSEKPYQYWRTPGSGSLCTIHEENAGLSGDIRALTTNAKFLTNVFSIECKTGYPGTSFWQHFADNKGFNIRDFWTQACRDAEKGEKIPMLIYRKKGKKPLLGMDAGVMGRMFFKTGYDSNSVEIRFKDKYKLPPVFICSFDEFFRRVKPDAMREYCLLLEEVLKIRYGQVSTNDK